MSDKYFIEEKLSSGKTVTVGFETQEQMDKWLKDFERKERKIVIADQNCLKMLQMIRADKNINDTFKRGIK